MLNLNVPGKILAIKPYQPGKPIEELEREYGIKNSIKLASNENPLGPSPKAIEAVQKKLNKMNRYPDGSSYYLTRKLSETIGVPPDTIIFGNGSDDIIALLTHSFLKTGDEAIIPYPSFLMYEISIQASAGSVVRIPLKNAAIDLQSMADAVGDRTRMIFLTNPNNPTGSHFTEDEFKNFLRKIPPDILIIVDEAYIEFARDPNIFNTLEISFKDPRLICLRTFSKAYGLAGFRVGYGVMEPEIIQILHRVRQPFNVNSLAQIAATAALDDIQFLEESINLIHKGIDYLTRELQSMGLSPFPTQANFLMVDIGRDASEIFEKMLHQGVIVRSMASYGFKTCLRINAGLDLENKAFIKALNTVIG